MVKKRKEKIFRLLHNLFVLHFKKGIKKITLTYGYMYISYTVSIVSRLKTRHTVLCVSHSHPPKLITVHNENERNYGGKTDVLIDSMCNNKYSNSLFSNNIKSILGTPFTIYNFSDEMLTTLTRHNICL